MLAFNARNELRQHRTIRDARLACILFRHISQKCSAIHKVLPALFVLSAEKSGGAIRAPELCGVALRAKAREKMLDLETRTLLDVEHPNPTFEELLEKKMRKKGLSQEEALQDIYDTATTTNEDVNNKFGIGGN